MRPLDLLVDAYHETTGVSKTQLYQFWEERAKERWTPESIRKILYRELNAEEIPIMREKLKVSAKTFEEVRALRAKRN